MTIKFTPYLRVPRIPSNIHAGEMTLSQRVVDESNHIIISIFAVIT